MKKYKAFINESNYKIIDYTTQENEIGFLQDLATDLTDEGLYVTVTDKNPKFHFKGCLYMNIDDKDKVFCKNYPEKDELDWIIDKPIINEFHEKLKSYGLIGDKDYKVYGGGTGMTIVFLHKARPIKLK